MSLQKLKYLLILPRTHSSSNSNVSITVRSSIVITLKEVGVSQELKAYIDFEVKLLVRDFELIQEVVA